MTETASLQERDAVDRQLEFASATLYLYKEAHTAYIDRSDCELEQWFARHRSELVNLTSLDVVRIAVWLTVIGLPANDNAHTRYRWMQTPD